MPGASLRIRGRANRHGFAVSSYDLDGDAETGDLAPVYPATEDVAQKTLRNVHAQALEIVRDVGDDVPAAVLTSERLPLRADALSVVHRPRSLPEAEVGRPRLPSTSSWCSVWRSSGRCRPRECICGAARSAG